jgi:uncharacterized membrane protein YccF (DUF307 family)
MTAVKPISAIWFLLIGLWLGVIWLLSLVSLALGVCARFIG